MLFKLRNKTTNKQNTSQQFYNWSLDFWVDSASSYKSCPQNSQPVCANEATLTFTQESPCLTAPHLLREALGALLGDAQAQWFNGRTPEPASLGWSYVSATFQLHDLDHVLVYALAYNLMRTGMVSTSSGMLSELAYLEHVWPWHVWSLITPRTQPDLDSSFTNLGNVNHLTCWWNNHMCWVL